MNNNTTPTATYAQLAASMPTRELLRASGTHTIDCRCDRCDALYAELLTRTDVGPACAAIAETDRLNGRTYDAAYAEWCTPRGVTARLIGANAPRSL
jgi:hypothetical protein